MHFYVSIFKDARIVSMQRYPENAPGPMAGFGGKVLTGVFELQGQRFMALDGGPGVFPVSGVVSFLVECKDQEEIDYYWEKLAAGGDPNAQQCGWLKDKYGFSWQIVPNMDRWFANTDTVAARRAMEAMLKMKKIDIAELDRAMKGV